MSAKYNISTQDGYDQLRKVWQRERAATQMTIGKMINILKMMPPDAPVPSLDPHSYRGYYDDLAFDPTIEKITVETALKILTEGCLGKTFSGYKGGDYVMGLETPVWWAEYGREGMRIMGFNEDGSFKLASDDDEPLIH